MNQRPRNEYLRVNRTGKYTRKSIFDQVHTNVNAIPQQPRQPQPKTQVYIIDKEDFKSIVQHLTSNQSCEFLPQNLPSRQKTRPEPINQTSPVPLNATAVHVSSHMRYIESLLEESSDSNGDHFQQSFDENQSRVQSMPYSNGSNQETTTTLPSLWFDGLPQQMDGAYSMQSTGVDYLQPLTPNFTFSSVTQPEAFGPLTPNLTYSSVIQPGFFDRTLGSF
ncbi:hypothetical protein N665_0295s0007 [Sinapis alba]|nr:hypothetical protein N665_0295s0007 [Sinapis alba]